MTLCEVYPYTGYRIVVREPIATLMTIDCEPQAGGDWRAATMRHVCLHKIDPDQWISQSCWVSLHPVTPFEQLPKLQTT